MAQQLKLKTNVTNPAIYSAAKERVLDYCSAKYDMYLDVNVSPSIVTLGRWCVLKYICVLICYSYLVCGCSREPDLRNAVLTDRDDWSCEEMRKDFYHEVFVLMLQDDDDDYPLGTMQVHMYL